MAEMHCFEASYLHAVTRQLLMAADTPRHIAEIVAEILINANLAGHDSHGVLRLPGYLGSVSNGGLQPAAEPEVSNETGNTFRVDGKDGHGHYTARRAMERAIEMAQAADNCAVSFVNTGHIGRLGEYAEQAARAGCIGIITYGGGTRGRGGTVPFGGARGALGTNPIAVGVPTGDDSPFIIDFATSMIAAGKVSVAASMGVDLPEGCIVDKHGNPSVKPADLSDGGSLLTFGAHKGYAFSLLVSLFAGLSGNFDIEEASMGSNTLMQVINISAFTPLGPYQGGVRAFLDGIKSIPAAPGFDEVLVPGDFEYRSRSHRIANGIDVPDTIYSQLQECAEKLNFSLSEDLVEPADAERYQA